MSPFEIVMLVCFGLAWPLSIVKTLRTKQSQGKSRWFLVVVLIGYMAGILHKVYFSFNGVIWLYILNFIMVVFDLYLVSLYSETAVKEQVLTERIDG